MLALEDLKDYSEDQVKKHLINQYCAKESDLEDLEILVAYESVGSWGCDSSSFFLLRNRTKGKLYENHGSHCSCYGFEGQYKPEETEIKSLGFRGDKGCIFSTGGYDSDSGENQRKVLEYVKNMDSDYILIS